MNTNTQKCSLNQRNHQAALAKPQKKTTPSRNRSQAKIANFPEFSAQGTLASDVAAVDEQAYTETRHRGQSLNLKNPDFNPASLPELVNNPGLQTAPAADFRR
ncbi:hypothetical protein J0X15_18725 [Roseibium sp. CAU 1637]|uniref:Uncharacterized protein n=1 Tax=Roseibium limicola TaxID=2816037 RepID=A0A939JAB9_9HYPH|nr:hypothetical protein [Roseibium limicola]MBO0347271.1 hypothetical protein [Roseibium limicola]